MFELTDALLRYDSTLDLHTPFSRQIGSNRWCDYTVFMFHLNGVSVDLWPYHPRFGGIQVTHSTIINRDGVPQTHYPMFSSVDARRRKTFKYIDYPFVDDLVADLMKYCHESTTKYKMEFIKKSNRMIRKRASK